MCYGLWLWVLERGVVTYIVSIHRGERGSHLIVVQSIDCSNL